MQTLDALRRNIAATEDLQSVVHTMRSLSAVSIRQYEKAAASLVDYNRTVEMGLQAVLKQHRSLIGRGPVTGPAAAIVCGSDYGLCGRFNENVTDFARRKIRKLDVSAKDCPMVAVGVRAAARLEALGVNVEEKLALPGSIEGVSDTVQTLIVKMEEWQESRGVRRVLIYHNRHTDQAAAEPQEIRLLPLESGRLEEIAKVDWPSNMLPLFTMDADRLISALVREYLFVVLCRACAESLASEHASRLAAMQAAERNIEERLEAVNAEYRRRRQQAITGELLDVVSGFEALQGEDDAR